MKLRLLIIEDDEVILDKWKEEIELYGVEENKPFEIFPKYCKNLNEAELEIDNGIFDAAVIDINLKGNSGNNNDHGNDVFKGISKNTLAVTVVYTGEPNVVDLGEEYSGISKVFTKDQVDIDNILEWIESEENMIGSMQKMRESIQVEMATLFSKSIWPRWRYWSDQQLNEDFTSHSLKRHMATHLHASFLSEGGTHPEEYFFIPPLRKELDTGDIFKLDAGFYILVTPRCDLARADSHETLQIIRLEDVSETFDKLTRNIQAAKEKGVDSNTAQGKIKRLTDHKNKSSNCHFIPALRFSDDKKYGPFLARFDELRSIEKLSKKALDLRMKNRGEFNKLDHTETFSEEVLALRSSKIASLSNEFVPSLVERLGNFFSRIGTPDYSHPE